MRKLIGFDDETLDKLVQLGRNRMATLQELADEAFADLLKKHGVPIDLRDALKKSVRSEEAGKRAGNTSRKRIETAARKLSRS
ncbi:hypothetical protein [Bradyrhizobium prioriisuperbiae]|uniref:hypothetical protein n=1 Tax=Bradyrhizobium prioriisuperbiae TaxID=2854389 RepID=UPI0028EEDEF9|nr:hypothetical protein [Bradyrhizobium prioritasuperba]